MIKTCFYYSKYITCFKISLCNYSLNNNKIFTISQELFSKTKKYSSPSIPLEFICLYNSLPSLSLKKKQILQLIYNKSLDKEKDNQILLYSILSLLYSIDTNIINTITIDMNKFILNENIKNINIYDNILLKLDNISNKSSIFNQQLLKNITWDNCNTLLMENIIKTETVHPFSSWEQVKERMVYDRYCYALFNSPFWNNPLIFVWVAFMKEIPKSIHQIIKPTYSNSSSFIMNSNIMPLHIICKNDASVAVFYSINSSFTGQIGIGNLLIKETCKIIPTIFPNIHTFVTLSPVPEFIFWINTSNKIQYLLNSIENNSNINDKQLQSIINDYNWINNNQSRELLYNILPFLCFYYLTKEKYNQSKYSLNRVTNFHLRNGAILENIHFLGNTSIKGLKESGSIMVNYKYDFKYLQNNSEEYKQTGNVKFSNKLENFQNIINNNKDI